MQEPENGKKRERLSSGHDMASRPQIHNRGYLHKTGPITIPVDGAGLCTVTGCGCWRGKSYPRCKHL